MLGIQYRSISDRNRNPNFSTLYFSTMLNITNMTIFNKKYIINRVIWEKIICISQSFLLHAFCDNLQTGASQAVKNLIDFSEFFTFFALK